MGVRGMSPLTPIFRWTCKNREGIKPTGDELPQPGDSAEKLAQRFWLYAPMYCKRCGNPSKLNRS